MEEKFILELTKDEVLMLQEMAGERLLEGYYKWMRDVAEGLETKAKNAYSKPHMSREEFEKAVTEEYEKWTNPPRAMPEVAFFMKRAKEMELRFYYDVEE